MAKTTKTQIKDTKDLLRGIAGGLRTAATRPNILGYEPHAKQVDFHSSPARGRLFIGGNRSGKTVGGATESVWRLIGKHPYYKKHEGPIRGRCISVDFLNGVEKIVRPEIARWVPRSELRGGSWETAYEKDIRTLYLENGSFLEFMSYDQDLDKFAGTSRHFIWFDEEPPKDVFDENMMRLIDTGGDWWITMTPVEGMTWIYDEIYIKSRTSELIHVTEVDTTENPTINTGEIEVLMAGLSADDKKARLHGRFVQRGGLIYPLFSESNVIEPMLPPFDWLHFNMMDHGFNNPTAWLWAAVDREGRMVVYDEHYERGRVVSYHARKVHEKNLQHGITPAYSVGDPSIRNTDPITGTSVLIEYIDHGVPIILGNNDVRAGIDRVAGMIGEDNNPHLPRKLYITKNCASLLYEIQRYRWATWATKKHNFEKNAKEEPHKKDDHACDALRYGVASRPLVEDQSIPENVSYAGGGSSVSPYHGLTDPGVTTPARERNFDDVLGEEW